MRSLPVLAIALALCAVSAYGLGTASASGPVPLMRAAPAVALPSGPLPGTGATASSADVRLLSAQRRDYVFRVHTLQPVRSQKELVPAPSGPADPAAGAARDRFVAGDSTQTEELAAFALLFHSDPLASFAAARTDGRGALFREFARRVKLACRQPHTDADFSFDFVPFTAHNDSEGLADRVLVAHRADTALLELSIVREFLRYSNIAYHPSKLLLLLPGRQVVSSLDCELRVDPSRWHLALPSGPAPPTRSAPLIRYGESLPLHIDTARFLSEPAPRPPGPRVPSRLDPPPAAMRQKLCTPQRVPAEDTVSMIDMQDTLDGVGGVLGGLLGEILDPVMQQVTETLVSDMADNVARTVQRPVTADVPDLVTSHTAKATIATLTNLLTDSVTGELTKRLTPDITENVAPWLQRELVDKVTPVVHKNLVRTLHQSISKKTNPQVTMALSKSLPLTLADRVSKGVTHGVVPTVLLAIQNTLPIAWQYPHCDGMDTVCQHMSFYFGKYYVNFHATYYCHYFSEYYSPYYVDAIKEAIKTQPYSPP